MTVYVDNAHTRATLGRYTGRWSHLTADTAEELHDFADRLGLHGGWFHAESRCYAVTDRLRDRAILFGANPVTTARQRQVIADRARLLSAVPAGRP